MAPGTSIMHGGDEEAASEQKDQESEMDPRKPKAGTEGVPPVSQEPDTEGHQFLPNPIINRQLAEQRERDIQRDLLRRERELEARRPHRRG